MEGLLKSNGKECSFSQTRFGSNNLTAPREGVNLKIVPEILLRPGGRDFRFSRTSSFAGLRAARREGGTLEIVCEKSGKLDGLT